MSGKRKVKLAPCAPYELDAKVSHLNFSHEKIAA